MVVFIDESGTLPDVADKYIVFVALISYDASKLSNILPKFRRKIPKKGSRKTERTVKELKFHYVGDITRRRVLEELKLEDVQVYALVVDKMGRKVADSVQNYGKLIVTLINQLNNKEEIKKIYIDKHFGDINKTNKLESFLKENTRPISNLEQVDSLQDSRIDLADFVAGAIFRKYRVSDAHFYDIISDKIVKEEVKKWNEV